MDLFSSLLQPEIISTPSARYSFCHIFLLLPELRLTVLKYDNRAGVVKICHKLKLPF